MEGTPSKAPSELRYYGYRQCLAIFDRRPEDIINVYINIDVSRRTSVATLLKYCAAKRLAYHVVEDDRLERMCQTTHHEGICILAKEKPAATDSEFLRALMADKTSSPILVLDGVNNPHNIGAIARTAAFFGINTIVSNGIPSVHLPASMCRVAEGAFEYLNFVHVSRPMHLLAQELITAGFELHAADVSARASLNDVQPKGRFALVLGAEQDGVSESVLRLCKSTFAIHPSGPSKIQSLNVVHAGAIAIHYLSTKPAAK